MIDSSALKSLQDKKSLNLNYCPRQINEDIEINLLTIIIIT